VAIEIRTKRVYELPEPADGYRVLVDRLWPRGLSRERAALDEWARELAPSDGLRRWFGHDPERFDKFSERYREELRAHAPVIEALRERASQGPVTIVYGARDELHNNAAVVAALLRRG
jgi:uncharacterized protein YeaO (DUF488 family)